MLGEINMNCPAFSILISLGGVWHEEWIGGVPKRWLSWVIQLWFMNVYCMMLMTVVYLHMRIINQLKTGGGAHCGDLGGELSNLLG